CHFSDKGFTWHVSKAAAFASTLDRLLESPQLPPQARERVRRYMYLFYFRTCYRLPVLEALQRLDDPPIDPEAFYQGYARLLTDTAAYETAQDHVRRFILG